MLVSQSTAPATITLIFDVVGVEGDVLVGLSSTSHPYEIVAASNGHTVSWRGPGEPALVDIEFNSVRLHRPGDIHEVVAFASGRADYYAAVIFEQPSPPMGEVIPCWTKSWPIA